MIGIKDRFADALPGVNIFLLGGVSTWWAIDSLPGNFPDKYGILNILKIIFNKLSNLCIIR